MKLQELLIGTEGIEALIAFLFFTLFGMLWVKIARFSIKRKKAKQLGETISFNLITWLNDNILDFLLAGMTSYGCHIFFPDLLKWATEKYSLPEFSDKMLYGLLIGLFFQWIFHKLFNNVKVVTPS